MAYRGILNRSEPRNNMVYVSYLFDKFGICLHYFAPFPHDIVPFTILHRVLITKAWPWRAGALSTVHDQHKIYHESRVMTWIGELLDLNLAEERPFLSACWYFDTFSCWVIQGTNLSPALPYISVSIWEHLAQNLTMFSKLLSICFSSDDWGHSENNCELWRWLSKTSYVNKTMLFLSSDRFNLI